MNEQDGLQQPDLDVREFEPDDPAAIPPDQGDAGEPGGQPTGEAMPG